MKKRIVLFALLCIMMIYFAIPLLSITSYATNGSWYDLGSGWKIRIDSPDSAKPYYHVHFYYKGAEKGCLRLDNLKKCDGFNNKSIPKWVEKAAKQKAANKGIGWGYNISRSTINWGRALALAGCAILVILATICPFDGPAGDVLAWSLLLGVA